MRASAILARSESEIDFVSRCSSAGSLDADWQSSLAIGDGTGDQQKPWKSVPIIWNIQNVCACFQIGQFQQEVHRELG